MLKYLKYGIEKKKKKRGTRAESVIERDCENAVVEGLGNSNTTDRKKQRDTKMCSR